MKVLTILKYVFTLIGVGLLLGALLSYRHTMNFLAEAEVAQGIVIELERRRSSDSTVYYPRVEFTDRRGRSHQFSANVGSNPPSYSRGEQVTVFYLRDNPAQAKIGGFFSLWGLPLILGSIGAVFALVGMGMIGFGVLLARRTAWLLQHGRVVEAEYQGVERNTSFEVNGRHPFRILAQWQNPATGKLHVFRSGNIWFDPTSHVQGNTIRVYIDKNNPKRYHVDIAFLPELA